MSFDLATGVRDYLATGKVSGLPHALFMDGVFHAAESRQSMPTWDPGTGRVFSEFAAGQAEDVDRAVLSSQKALKGEWSRFTPSQRGKLLRNIAELIRKNSDRLSFVEALDSGKRLDEAMGDVAGAANCFDYYAGASDKYQGISIPLGPDYVAYTLNEPLGVTAHIIPWNYPLSTAARGIAPALAAGCTVVAKPAEQTPLTALILAELCIEAGLPKGVFNVITGTGQAAGAALVKHPGVHHITFTGSVTTGIDVMREAATNITHLLLELGGKSPNIVFSDATDLAQAAKVSALGIYRNSGQVCVAGSRLLVQREVHDEFVERLHNIAAKLRVGDPLDVSTEIGAVCSARQLAKNLMAVQTAQIEGARLVVGGQALHPIEGGNYMAPALFDGVTPNMTLAREEVFGPVLAVLPFDDDVDAVRLANDSTYGLASAVWTGSLSRAHRMVRAIKAGVVHVNTYGGPDITVPLGLSLIHI